MESKVCCLQTYFQLHPPLFRVTASDNLQIIQKAGSDSKFPPVPQTRHIYTRHRVATFISSQGGDDDEQACVFLDRRVSSRSRMIYMAINQRLGTPRKTLLIYPRTFAKYWTSARPEGPSRRKSRP